MSGEDRAEQVMGPQAEGAQDAGSHQEGGLGRVPPHGLRSQPCDPWT